MTITKSNLINEAAIMCGTTRECAKNVIEQFFDVVKDSVKNNKSVEIRGFGTFSPKTCGSRVGRNLKTGELIKLAAGKSINLKFPLEFKAKIAGCLTTPEAANKQVQAHELVKTN